jgi:hypothetical protein
MMKLAIGLVLSVSLWLTTVRVFAAAANSPAVLLVVEGTDTEAAREIASSGLPGTRLEGSQDLLVAVADQGVAGSVGQALVNPRTRRATILAVRRGMKRVGATGVLFVNARPSNAGAKSVHVVLLVSTQSEPLIEEDIAVPKGQKAAPRVASRLSTFLAQLPAPAAEEPGASTAPTQAAAKSSPVALSAPVAAPATASALPPAAAQAIDLTPQAPPELPAPSAVPIGPKQNEPSVLATEKDATATKRRPLDHSNAMAFAEVSVGLARRSLDYVNASYGPLYPYRAPAIGVYSFGGEIYPAASSGIDVAKDIGLVGRVANSLSVESKSDDGTQTARAAFWRYDIGLRGRILAGKAKDSPLVGLEGTYGVWSFLFGGDPDLVDQLPPVQYRYLRAGADVRVPVGVFSLLGAAGYMSVLSAGPLTDRFPNARIFGVDATIGGTYPVMPWVDVRLALTYARMFSNTHADPDADYVAAGALDQYFIGNLGVSAIF